MVVHVQKIGEDFAAIIPPQVVDELGLVDGSALEISPVRDAAQPAVRYVTAEEALRAFEDTLPQHEAAYRELAK
jgi:antitoxin component of MazEF toxin-antitoxin module